jgi:hypothetical protein
MLTKANKVNHININLISFFPDRSQYDKYIRTLFISELYRVSQFRKEFYNIIIAQNMKYANNIYTGFV